MMVRCGACRTEFDVTGEGRFPCPTCGAVNQVGGEAPSGPPPGVAPPPGPTPESRRPPGSEELTVPPTAPPSAPAETPKVACSNCQFEFFVGDIEVAECPNCGAEVSVDGADS